ncbi:MAG: aldo/keto reductase [Cytophagales bacterium]|nr:aldo/keto reductase [Cytophagales bacterium]
MADLHKTTQSRRQFIKTGSALAAGLALAPQIKCSTNKVTELMRRPFGKTGRDVTTFGLGGQASIQWTPTDVDPVNIILKTFDQGVNYFDTSNLYGPSQLNFGKAFKELSLIPGRAGYDEPLRRSVFLTSKTHLRWAKGGEDRDGVRNRTNGVPGSFTVDDLKRSLSQIFGDGAGNYPKGAYLDMMLIHNLNTHAEVDALYTGYGNPDPGDESIGALAALLDYRDGTNNTGLNPNEEKLINHIGFSGHYSAAVMMDMIQRDYNNILDAMLVAVNANDKLNFNMQNNVIPVAKAKNMGIIAMKVFADGAMYTKPAGWSNEPRHVVRGVGSKKLPSRPLIEYSLSTPGISTAIIGIGEINDDPTRCQLAQNISSAQIGTEGLSEVDRADIEKLALHAKEGKTNYFQVHEGGLTSVHDLSALRADDAINLTWNSAFAGNDPLKIYEIFRDDKLVGKIDHKPQTSKKPFAYVDKITREVKPVYKVVAIDDKGNRMESVEVSA